MNCRKTIFYLTLLVAFLACSECVLAEKPYGHTPPPHPPDMKGDPGWKRFDEVYQLDFHYDHVVDRIDGDQFPQMQCVRGCVGADDKFDSQTYKDHAKKPVFYTAHCVKNTVHASEYYDEDHENYRRWSCVATDYDTQNNNDDYVIDYCDVVCDYMYYDGIYWLRPSSCSLYYGYYHAYHIGIVGIIIIAFFVIFFLWIFHPILLSFCYHDSSAPEYHERVLEVPHQRNGLHHCAYDKSPCEIRKKSWNYLPKNH